jgi:hypothetical protein
MTEERAPQSVLTAAALPPSASPSPLVYYLCVDADPSRSDHYASFLVPDIEDRGEWLDDVLALFPLCGVCHARPPTDVQLSAPWPAFVGFCVTGFVSCAEDACVRMSQTRARTRREASIAMVRAKQRTTPDSVVKACAHCAAPREQQKTFVCGRCQNVRYCNSDCQRAHWTFHKKFCLY